MAVQITKHAKQRARERGLPPHALRKAVRRLAHAEPGKHEIDSGHTVVLERHRGLRGVLALKTVLAPGMQ